MNQKGHPFYKAYCWMRQNAGAYIDQCGEVDCTRLAEDAANEFDLYTDDDGTIPVELFEGSFLIGEKMQAEQRKTG